MHTSYVGGRHELGQNFLTDRAIINTIVNAVATTSGSIIEIGPGDGALSIPLERLGRPLTCVEIDARRAARLERRLKSTTELVVKDFMYYRLPDRPYVLVGNLPFHLTTAMLRRIVSAPQWTTAIVMVQWEVARRRAGVGGATMMTAQWWPWYEFALLDRVPARAFRPMPSVDGGLLAIRRRQEPLVASRADYQAFVQRAFTGKGRGLPQIIARASSGLAPRQVAQWMRQERLPATALPKHLTADQWADLYALSQRRETQRPLRSTRSSARSSPSRTRSAS